MACLDSGEFVYATGNIIIKYVVIYICIYILFIYVNDNNMVQCIEVILFCNHHTYRSGEKCCKGIDTRGEKSK